MKIFLNCLRKPKLRTWQQMEEANLSKSSECKKSSQRDEHTTPVTPRGHQISCQATKEESVIKPIVHSSISKPLNELVGQLCLAEESQYKASLQVRMFNRPRLMALLLRRKRSKKEDHKTSHHGTQRETPLPRTR